ncbi:MAG: dihydrolipoyllysine-residue succinyltransferase, partial [Pseudomonadota bacterium]|nr:dihydrolipoyllysine-residue succinyltransferase [Pseudomonadota bacterium]
DGVLKEIKFEEGATVNSQQVIAVIEEGAVGDSEGGDDSKDKQDDAGKEKSKNEKDKTAVGNKAKEADERGGGKDVAKPAKSAAPASKSSGKTGDLPPGARFTAENEGIDPSNVEGTGRRGAVTKEDLVNYASGKTPGVSGGARPEERVPMTRIRKRIAERLMQSKNSIAMLTSFNEINLGKVMAMRKELGEQFQKAHGIKLGFMGFFAKAAASALQRHPAVNATVDGDDIIYHGYADISIAVSTDRGLMTPVLRNVERMGFAEVEQAIADYATKARDGKLALEDLQGGTFTITNGGTFGSLMSTPIVNPPQSAILGMHAIKERAIVDNGQVVAAPMMYIALSYDHRIIDGKDAVLFLVDIKDQLENPHRMLLGM